MSKFFKDNKIKIMYLLIMYMNADEKTSVKTDVNFGSAFVVCICSLHSCYNFALVTFGMHSFSANQMLIIFSCPYLWYLWYT